MKPINFPEANIVFAKDQKEYSPLPAFREPSEQGEVITCWQLSFRERLRVLFSGKVWLAMLSFNKPLTPTFMSVKKSDVLESPESKQCATHCDWPVCTLEGCCKEKPNEI